MSPPERVVGGLFVGGASRRMGQDKAELTRDGERLVARGVRVLSAVCAEVVLVGGHTYAGVEAARLEDSPSAEGPLAGVIALLDHAGSRRAVALAVDMPFVEPEHLRLLLAQLGSAAACTEGRWDPFCAVYDPVAALPLARAQAARGERRLQRLWGALGASVVALPREALADWDSPADIA